MRDNPEVLSPMRILLTGGKGFIGRYTWLALVEAGHDVRSIGREFDLRKEKDVISLFHTGDPYDAVIHLAGTAGGIKKNKENPGAFLYDNVMMNTLCMEHARQTGVKKFVGIGSVAAYPAGLEELKEKNLWEGQPSMPYGAAKRLMTLQAQTYRDQYQFNAVTLLLTNVYGPEDHFDKDGGHVIASMISKFVDAKKSNTPVTLWGDGTATRDFIHVRDAARAIVWALNNYNDWEPINIASGCLVTTAELAKEIADLSGFNGMILWDKTQPGGGKRSIYLERMESKGFHPQISLRQGLKETIEYYENMQARLGNA